MLPIALKGNYSRKQFEEIESEKIEEFVSVAVEVTVLRGP
jgi:hypothetical protein